MNALNLEMINSHSEYQVFLSQTGKYLFKTDFDILYAVDFELDNNPYYTAYWFNLTNPKNTKSPGDIKIAQTVICIIEEFFRLNPEVLLYMCSTDNGQQAMRNRLFLRWFSGYEQQKKYGWTVEGGDTGWRCTDHWAYCPDIGLRWSVDSGD